MDKAIVGLIEVLQTNPRAVIEAPPSDVTFPPPVAVVFEIAVTGVVVMTVGAISFAVYVIVQAKAPFVRVIELPTQADERLNV